MANKKIELLCPAGDRERLEMVLHYGADAVYLAGKNFGMRASAGNFDIDGLFEARKMCSEAEAKLYVTVNTLPREQELRALPEYLEALQDVGADGLIIADLGVMEMAKKYAPKVELHVSTQLGIMNSATATALYNMGAKRVVLAREMRMDEIREMRENTPKELELEAFVHGAMCVSFSGRCLLSNYLTGRDANGGACAQPCRWKYHLVEEKRPGEYFEITEDKGTYIMNSNDMCMVDHIAELDEAGIASFKIEGRMKSAYYAAMTTYAYRGAIDDYLAGKSFDPRWLDECNKVSHRKYSTGFYYGDPGQYYGEVLYFGDADVCGIVEECDGSGEAIVSQRNKFVAGDTLELVTRGEMPVRFTVSDIRDENGQPMESAPHPMQRLRMNLPGKAERLSVIRKLKNA